MAPPPPPLYRTVVEVSASKQRGKSLSMERGLAHSKGRVPGMRPSRIRIVQIVRPSEQDRVR